MKIERINDNQFRCIMSMGELLQRHLTIKKLSSSPPEASRLVRELIERSSHEVGFVPNELPVMVEATQTPEGELVFTVTKINSPEELPPAFQPQAELLRILHGFASAVKTQQEEYKLRQPKPLAVFGFYGKENLKVPPRLKKLPAGIQSSLYYLKEQDVYYLIVSASPKHGEQFNQVCLLLAEYGHRMPSTSASGAYYAEQGECIYAAHAIEQMGTEA